MGTRGSLFSCLLCAMVFIVNCFHSDPARRFRISNGMFVGGNTCKYSSALGLLIYLRIRWDERGNCGGCMHRLAVTREVGSMRMREWRASVR